MLYCIEVYREIEDVGIIHHDFKQDPTREEVLKVVADEDYNYDDNYGKLKYYPISAPEGKK